MNEKSRITFITILTIFVTFLCNFTYFYSYNNQFLKDNSLDIFLGKFCSIFTFNNSYLGNSYTIVIVWKNFIIALIIGIIISHIAAFIIKNFTMKFPKEAKIADKVFIIMFLLLLILPASRFDNSFFNYSERRILAPKPQILLPQKGNNATKNKFQRFNKNYFKDFENYVNDRFFTRTILIHLYEDFIYNTAIRYPHHERRVIDKKAKLIDRYFYPPIYQKKLSGQKYKKFVFEINDALTKFNEYCKDNNIAFYVMIYPQKASIHKSELLNYNSDSDIKEFISDINPKNKVNMLFPLDEFKNEVKNGKMLYYKTDHHLTNEGNYIAYKLLMNEIKKSFPDIKTVNKNDYIELKNELVKIGMQDALFNGSICNLVKLTKQQCDYFLDYQYSYYFHKNHKKLNYTEFKTNILRSEEFYYEQAQNKRVLLVGNSNVEDLPIFMAYTFKNLYKIRLNAPRGIAINEQYKVLKYYSNIIKYFKPDIIVLCIDYDSIKLINKIHMKN